MSRYIARKCPRCRDYFGVAVHHPTPKSRELPITGLCAVCGYQLKGWRLLLGRRRIIQVYEARTPKVFR